MLRLLVHQGWASIGEDISPEADLNESFARASIRGDGSKEKKISELDQEEKLVYAMKCFVSVEDGTEKTLLKNIFEWWRI